MFASVWDPFVTCHHIQKYHIADRMVTLKRLTDLEEIITAFNLSERTHAFCSFNRYIPYLFLMRIALKALKLINRAQHFHLQALMKSIACVKMEGGATYFVLLSKGNEHSFNSIEPVCLENYS